MKYEPPTEEGLYSTGKGQVWELGDDGQWSEVHGDSAEFGDHPFLRLMTREEWQIESGSRDPESYTHLAYANDIARAWDENVALIHGCGYEKAPPPEDEFDAQPIRPLCPFCIRAAIYYGTGRVPEPDAPRLTAAEIREHAKQEQAERDLINEAVALMAKSFWLRNNPKVEGGWASA